MTYLIEHVFQIKQDLSLNVFDIIKGKNESKTITISVSGSLKIQKIIIRAKKINLEFCYT